MCGRASLVDAIKQHISWRADWMMLPYDPVDLDHMDLEDGHTIIALKWIQTPEYAWQGDDMPPVKIADKTPNIDITLPSTLDMHYRCATNWDRITSLPISIPIVRVRWPQLVFIIQPDGNILDGGHKEYPVTHDIPQVTGSAECIIAVIQQCALEEEKQRAEDYCNSIG